jgi:hypothetical protein
MNECMSVCIYMCVYVYILLFVSAVHMSACIRIYSYVCDVCMYLCIYFHVYIIYLLMTAKKFYSHTLTYTHPYTILKMKFPALVPSTHSSRICLFCFLYSYTHSSRICLFRSYIRTHAPHNCVSSVHLLQVVRLLLCEWR